MNPEETDQFRTFESVVEKLDKDPKKQVGVPKKEVDEEKERAKRKPRPSK